MPSTEAHKVKQLVLCNLHNSGPLPVECRPPQYQMARLPEFTLSTKTGDNCCSLQGHILVVSNIAFTKSDSMPCVIGQAFLSKGSFYSRPFDSTSIGIYSVSRLSSVKCWPLKDCTKLVKLPYSGTFLCFLSYTL